MVLHNWDTKIFNKYADLWLDYRLFLSQFFNFFRLLSEVHFFSFLDGLFEFFSLLFSEFLLFFTLFILFFQKFFSESCFFLFSDRFFCRRIFEFNDSSEAIDINRPFEIFIRLLALFIKRGDCYFVLEVNLVRWKSKWYILKFCTFWWNCRYHLSFNIERLVPWEIILRSRLFLLSCSKR